MSEQVTPMRPVEETRKAFNLASANTTRAAEIAPPPAPVPKPKQKREPKPPKPPKPNSKPSQTKSKQEPDTPVVGVKKLHCTVPKTEIEFVRSAATNANCTFADVVLDALDTHYPQIAEQASPNLAEQPSVLKSRKPRRRYRRQHDVETNTLVLSMSPAEHEEVVALADAATMSASDLVTRALQRERGFRE